MGAVTRIISIQDGGSQSVGGLGFQRVDRPALSFSRLRPPSVQQLDPLHSSHLLPVISDSHSHRQETWRGFFRVSTVTKYPVNEILKVFLRSNPCRELAWFLTTGIVVS